MLIFESGNLQINLMEVEGFSLVHSDFIFIPEPSKITSLDKRLL
jgi:hypothetical protein